MVRGTQKCLKRGGFTLIELMIAITVLLVAVLSTLIAQISAHDLLASSRETNTAMADLETCMERVLMRPIDQIPIASSEFAAEQPVAAFEGLNLRDERIVATYPGYTAGATAVPDPLTIQLTLTWNDPKGRPRSLRLASMKTR